jgi:hypothetical protein
MGLSRVAAGVWLIAAGCGGGQAGDGAGHAGDAGQPPAVDGQAPGGMAGAGMEAGAGVVRTITWHDAEETIVSGAAQQFQVGFNNTTIAVRLPDALLVIWSKEGALALGRRAPGGGAWSVTPLAGAGTGETSRPSLVHIEGRTLLAAWSERTGGRRMDPHMVVATLSLDGGATWLGRRRLTATGDADGVSLAPLEVGGRPGALIAWSELTTHEARFALWNGGAWTDDASLTAGKIDAAAGAIDVTVFSRGARAFAAWESSPALPAALWAAQWDDSARAFKAAVQVSTGMAGAFGDPGGCIDGNGRLYIAAQNSIMGSGGRAQILLMQAEPGVSLLGLTPVVLGPGFFPQVACDGRGTVAVAWEHATTGAKDDANKTVALSLSLDGNVTRAGPHAVPGSPTATGRGYPAVIVTDRHLDYYWQDIAGQTLTLKHRQADLP